jgi:hypothetical protein
MEGVGVWVGVRASIPIIVHLSYDGGGGSNSGGCGGRMSTQMHTSRAKMSIALYKCSSHKSEHSWKVYTSDVEESAPVGTHEVCARVSIGYGACICDTRTGARLETDVRLLTTSPPARVIASQ